MVDQPSSLQQNGSSDPDGQVVASARALMRYRRTKSSTTDGSIEKSWGSATGLIFFLFIQFPVN